ncbi:MAG TPA: DUF4160 domain-containing protein [Anaerolineae bacterium]|nr:DUF4160 domain-containing protein [Anaerolineae bacterium]
MSPTVLRVGRYRFFFNSREESRRHVHVATADGVAKFWLEPIVALASYYNLRSNDLRAMEALVREREDEFRAAWDRHFSQ